MSLALSQAAAIGAFFAIGTLCGVCAALVSFSRTTKRRKLSGFLLDFFAIALPGALLFAALHTLCGGELRAAHAAFAVIGAIAAYSLAKKPAAAIRRRLRRAGENSKLLKKLLRILTK